MKHVSRYLAVVWLQSSALAALCGSCTSSSLQYCDSDEDCQDGMCMAEPDDPPQDLEPLLLVCGTERAGAETGARCHLVEDCARGICMLAGTCAVACLTSEHCGPDERCMDAYARTSDTTLQPVRACVSVADLPQDAEAHSEVRHGFLTGDNATDVLALPAAEPTALFVLEHLAGEAWPAFTPCRSPLCVTSLRTRDVEPVVLFDAGLYARSWEPGDEPPLNPVAVGGSTVGHASHPPVIMLPNGPRSALSPAGYEVLLAAELAGDLRVTGLFKPAGGTRLDVNLFYAGGRDWTPTGNRGPTLLAEALAAFEHIYSSAGISLGQVRQIDVVGALRQRFEFIELRYGVLERLPELFALSAGAGNSALNLFFVRQIEGQGAPVMAVSGGVPGPLGMHGTGASGIAISADLFDNADALAKALAHEVGHHLGLFHTTESNGAVLDPLPDSPECPLDRDTDADGQLNAQECQDFGADNLMFWAMNRGTHITQQQADVLRSAPILHP